MKITRAMELIAASRIVKAQQRVISARPYADLLTQAMEDVARQTGNLAHPLLEEREASVRAGVLVMTSDRGLAGSFNANLLKRAEDVLRRVSDRGLEPVLYVTGKKAISYFRFRGVVTEGSWSGFSEVPAYGAAEELGGRLIEDFASRRIDELQTVYTDFRSAFTFRATDKRFLPIAPEEVGGAADGLPVTGPRRLALGTEGIWLDTWSGLYLMRRTGATWRAESIPGTETGALCAGSSGTLWTGSAGRFLERREGRFVEHPGHGFNELSSCAAGAEGRLWLGTDVGLFLATDDGLPPASPRRVQGPPALAGDAGRLYVHEDASGRLWFSRREEICSVEARALASGGSPAWSCGRAEGARQVVSFVQTQTGDLWAATLRSGVVRLRPGGSWEPIPGSSKLPGEAVRSLRPSPSGGVWIVGYGTILRVVERPDAPDGWEIVERPAPWHGLMISDAEDILESPGGDLWITTLAGLVNVPAEVRRSEPPVPRVELVDVLVDGQSLAADRPLALPYRKNRIELRFAGLSYRDAGLLRYQVRLGPGESWIDASGRPSFRFVDLPPGRYHAEVRASLDGRLWSPETARLSFAVLPPFWRTWWFLALAALAAAAASYGLFRYRLAQLLRLERVRTRIAADLHDDIGASLSRIALQSELVRRPSAQASQDLDRLLGEIGESARALVDSMSDIVWSIDPRRDDLASLIARVRQFALGLTEPRGIVLDFPTPEGAGRVRLQPERRRHLYLILKEAVSNVVKHAECRNVWISLLAEGEALRAEVRDDGRGFVVRPSGGDRPDGRAAGNGLRNMKLRAGEMSGALEVRSSPGQGTLLRLTVPARKAGA